MSRTPSTVGNFSLKTRSSQPIEKHLTIAEVAELTGTSDSTVRRWISRGELRAYNFGPRAIRVDPADLRAFRSEVNPTTFAHVSGGGAQ